jgi:hypothetical protein
MMFGRKKKEKDYGWQDKAADKIVHVCIQLQSRFAKFMDKHVSTISPRRLKIILILFCVMSGGLSFYLSINALFEKKKIDRVLEVKRIHTPRHFDRTGDEVKETGNHLSESLYSTIQQYKRYMDSTGQAIRPGLADSIKQLERIYHSQKIK